VPEVLLNKSSFLLGVQCKKALMLNALQPELAPPPDAGAQFRMHLGQQVGQVAQARYPSGRIGRVPDSYPQSMERTRRALEDGVEVIYEAAFEAEGVRVVADILVRAGHARRLIEVKSTTSVKPEHVWDVAIQFYVLRRSGVEIEDAALLHLNREYSRAGSLDLEQLFTEASLYEDVLALQDPVEQELEACKAMLAAGVIPDIDIGQHCTDPVECSFKAHCWSHLPQPSIFDVYYIGKKAFGLYEQGITSIESVPAEAALDKRSLFHIAAHKSGEVILDRRPLQAFLEALKYPLYYLDFETLGLPIPPHDGLRPYSQLPFQYSLHIQAEPGGELEHRGYLAEPGADPRPGFLERLLEDTAGEGDIVVYHQPFEQGVLAEMARMYPGRSNAIESLMERVVDLLEPFRKRWYWHPRMGGSNSLKDVLPVFAVDLSYKALEIQHGEAAMQAFFELEQESDPIRIAALRAALWAYCELDTLAMVHILDGLRECL
jgi:hypothetical protein